MIRIVVLTIVAVALLSPLPTWAYPKATCTLSADKASVVVIGSNNTDVAYQCMAECRANVSGQRAIERVKCNFNLARNAAEKAVCEQKSSGKAFTALSPTKMTCVPR